MITVLDYKMNVIEYIKQFAIIDPDSNLECCRLSQMLYGAILNKFKIKIDTETYYYFKEYQERVFDFVENLRELSSATMPLIFDYLLKTENVYLIDIIIMLWCLPRSDNFLSKKMYNNKYHENIKKYNQKLINNITHKSMECFCFETLGKTNSVPVHCIDYIWFYMNGITMELQFLNYDNASYINFVMPDGDEHSDEDNTLMHVCIGINMEYVLEMGLGKIEYDNCILEKGTFGNFLKKYIIDMDIVKSLITKGKINNYQRQLINISKNPSKYFGEDIEIPNEVRLLIE